MRPLAAALAATLAACPLAALAQPAEAPNPPAAGPAEPPPPLAAPRPVLTFDAALRRASEANLDLKAARTRLDEARAGVAKAWSLHLLRVTGGASYTRNSAAAALDLPTGFWVRELGPGNVQGPPAGGAVPGSPTSLAVVPSGAEHLVLQERDQLGVQVEASQPLLAPSLWFAIRASEAGAASAERSLEAARRAVVFGAAQAYAGAASLARLVGVSERLLEIARRQERDARGRYEAGTVARIALVRAEIDRAQAEQDLVRARSAYDSGRIALALLLDRDDDFDVAEVPEPALPADPAALVDAAARERPEVAAARLDEDVARSLRAASGMRYLPAVGAFGRWQRSNVAGIAGREDVWAVGVGLSWTLLDGGLREAELREGSARVAGAAARRSAAEARARAEVRDALLQLAAARANARKAREQAELAAENRRLVQASFESGAATAVEQADAAAALRNAEVAAETEALRAQVAAMRVLYAAGRFAG